MRKFIFKSTAIILSALFLASCGDNIQKSDDSNAESKISAVYESTIEYDSEIFTEDVFEDTAPESDTSLDIFNSFDADDYFNKIRTVFSRPVPQSHTEIKNINDVAFMCCLSAINRNSGPIGIVPAKYYINDTHEDVYFIFLGGTEFKDGQATDIKTDILSGFGKNNDYLTSLIDTVKKAVPENSKLFLAGISLGGMVAQQFISDESIANCYEIVNTTCMGSPLIINEKSSVREGTVRRIEDKKDFIPNLSIYSVNPFYRLKYSREVISENGQYENGLYAHTFSYVDNDVWKKYDVAGTENGSALLTFNADNITYYDAPIK